MTWNQSAPAAQEPNPVGFTQFPRQDSANGRIRRCRFYLSQDGQAWGEPVSAGQFPTTAALQTAKFAEPHTGRYLRIVALDEWGRQYYTTLAELDIMARK